MILAAAPLGNDQKDATAEAEKNTSGSNMLGDEAIVEESPSIVRHFTLESEKEVTIRQVAPLVMVLTGATFLNVGIPMPHAKREANVK
jgi:hypothetical protein